MTLKVVAAFHWQTLRLWLKGALCHAKPEVPPPRSVFMSLSSATDRAPQTAHHGIVELDQALSLPGLTRWTRLVLHLARRLEYGTVLLTLPDGPTVALRGRTPGPSVDFIMRDQGLSRRLLLRGGLGFAEAYLDGDWEAPDLAALLGVLNVNEAMLEEIWNGKPWARALSRIGHFLNRNSKAGSRRNIAHHYDLGNRFYSEWLDPTMTYSAAVFERPGQDLAQAQITKYDLLADKIALQPGDHVLEVGCGWGGFAERAARQHGAKVTSITISAEQHAFAAKRIFEAGLADRVEVRLTDYRDVAGQFDKIASIEMFEAVGERYWPTYFGCLRDRLKPGGVAGLQVITIADRHFAKYRRGVDFIQKYVFPGGMLPSPSAFAKVAAAAGLHERGRSTHGLDYAVTLQLWRDRFEAAWTRIRPLGFDDRFRRLWNYYLAYCEAGFRTGSIDVMQVALSKV
jgi:cyclopropane-fatty-acyl-phospholipid synthase